MSIKNRFNAIHKAANKRYKKPGRIIVYSEIVDRPGVYNAICSGEQLGTGTEAELDATLDLTDDDTIIVYGYYDMTTPAANPGE